jgi:hypothetical protein
MERFYYENKLSNQNITAKPNIAWTADIMGHEDIRSTMYYQRYALSKTEIQSLLDQINE